MPKQAESHESITAAERIAAAIAWSDGAKAVAEQTGDSKADRLYQNYIATAGIAQFETNGLRWLAGSKQPKILLVPIFVQENIATPDIARHQQDDAPLVANYIENRPGDILFSGTVKMTPMWKGLALLHEAAHADADYQKKYSPGHDSHWQEEVDVFRLEHRWIATLGGEVYDDFVSAEVARFLEEYDDHNGSGGDLPALIRGPQLDQAFGLAASERETAVRRTATWFNVVYEMFEQKYGVEQGRRDMVGLTKGYYASRTDRTAKPAS
jgi:hypothetical protein